MKHAKSISRYKLNNTNKKKKQEKTSSTQFKMYVIWIEQENQSQREFIQCDMIIT
jgi:hypothetical protein